MPQVKIDFVSGSCGAGKSHGACRSIKENLHEKNFLYVAPSLILVSEIAERLRSMDVSARVITGETHPKSVKRAVMEALESSPGNGCCLFITWQAFAELPFFPNREEWQLIVDEIPQLDCFYKLKVPFNQRFVTEHVEIDHAVNERVGLLRARDPGKLKSLLNKPRDDVHGLFTDFYRDVVSRHRDVFVDIVSWTRVLEEKAVGGSDDENSVFAVSLLSPKLLDGAIMLGANFERSMIYDWFQRYHRVGFREFEPIKEHLRPVVSRSREIRVFYFLERSFFSKHKAKQRGSGGGAIIEAMDREAASLFGEAPFLYVTNNDRNASSLEEGHGARRMKVGSHGLNRYDGFHNIYFSAALNREPGHLGILRDLGFDLSYVHEATTHEVIYQSVMRTSLRRPDATNPVTILVPDSKAAYRLQDLIGATHVTKLGNIESPKPRPLTAAERKSRLKVTKHTKDLFAAKREQNMLIDIKCTQIAAEYDKRNLISSNSPTCFVTFHQSRYAKSEDEFIFVPCSHQDFIATFRLYARTPIAKKERFFFIPARFDPSIDPKQGYRTQANFHSASMLVLDFDNGSLSPEKFVEMFWTKAGRGQKRSFLLCNTFSRSPEQPNRFRAILFFKTPARSLAAYQAVFDAVIARIVADGYPTAEMGIDMTSRSGVQPFYIPCTNRAYPDHAFFEHYGTDSRDILRHGIDPSSYFKTAPTRPTLERTKQSSINIAASLSSELFDMKRKIMAMSEGRHALFFDFACKTAIHFKDEAKVAAELYEVAGSDPKLRVKVKPALNSLRKYGLI